MKHLIEQQPLQVVYKKLLLKILQYSQDKTCVGVFFNKVAGLWACNFIEKRLQHRCFPAIIAKFLRTPILKNFCEWLFLAAFNRPFEKLMVWKITRKTYKLSFVFEKLHAIVSTAIS